jgi:predicted transcriptional regulator
LREDILAAVEAVLQERSHHNMTIATTLKVGIASLEQYKARTVAIARGDYKPSLDEPKVWFQSIESLSQVLSEKNRALLALIASTEPESVNELALRTGRAKSTLSRTLKTLEQYGLIHFEKGPGRRMAPRANYSGVSLEMSFR